MPTTSKRFPSPARLALAAVLALACVQSAFAQKKAKIFGFYPNFDLTPMLTNAQLDLLTHVIYFSIKMPSDGQVTDAYVITQINGQKLVDIVSRGRDRGVKVLLGVGGWQLSNEFAGVAGSDALRKAFASSAAKFCQENGLAGMDIDWEFPTGNQANLASLLTEVSKTFKPAGLTLTMSVNGVAPEYYGSSALNIVDYVLIMSYDNGTPHSTYDQAVQAVGAFAGQVTAKSKLILGMPFYGKSGGATESYGDLMKSNPSLSASANDYAGYNFNGPDLIAQKTGYILDQGGGGTMIWQVSQDAMTTAAPGGVLLTAMDKSIQAKGAALDKPVVGVMAPLSRQDGWERISLRRKSGGFSLSAGSLAPGAYRLTLIDPAGKTLAQSLALLPSGEGGDGERALDWPGVALGQGAFIYRVDKDSRLVTAGQIPESADGFSRSRAAGR